MPSKAETIVKRQKAFDYFIEGHSWAETAEHVGYASAGSVCQAVTILMRQQATQSLNYYRDQELRRLALIDREMFGILRTRHRAISTKGEVAVDEDGAPLYDEQPRIKAADTIIKSSVHRSRLLGLNEPIRTRVESVTHAEIDSEIEGLMADLAGNDPAPADDYVG